MTDNKPPAYPWYPRDFTADEPVQLMSLEEEGAYRRLLDHQWLNGSIPMEMGQLAKVCKNVSVAKMRRLWLALVDCFVAVADNPNRLVNRKLERVRIERQAYLDRQSESGRRGAETRWERERARHSEGNGNPNGTASATPLAESCIASASASASATTESHPDRRVRRLSLTEDEQAVIDHYRSVHPRRLRGDIPDKTLRLLRNALTGYSVPDLRQAINGNAGSQFHRDGNHLGLNLILRDSEKLDYFMGLGAEPDTKECTDDYGVMRKWRKTGVDQWEIVA